MGLNFADGNFVQTSIETEAQNVVEQYDDLIAVFDDAKDSDAFANATLPPTRIKHTAVPTFLENAIDDAFEEERFATRVQQRDLLRPMDRLQQQTFFANPCVEYYDPLMPLLDKLAYARTIDSRSRARNGTALWELGVVRRAVSDRRLLSTFMREAEWLVAVRLQLGIGMADIAGRLAAPGTHCNCHQNAATDFFTDQHFRGCPHGHGRRNTAHKNIQNTFLNLARKGNFTIGNRDITCNFSIGSKEMDVVVHDPDSALTIHIDFRRTDSLCKTYQDNRTNTCNARTRTFKKATAAKADTYAAESAHHNAILTTFCVDSNGGYCPRDANYNPGGKLDPSVIINTLFKNGITGPDDEAVLHHSVEEGLVRLFSAQAADVENNGQGAYDRTLPIRAAAAMFASQTHRLIAYHAIRGSAQAVLRSLVRSTRFN